MGMLSIIANAIKQSYKNDGIAKAVAEGSSDVAQNILSPGTPLLAEALAGAVIPSIPKALQRNPYVSFSPSLLNRGRALVNSTSRLFPGSLALAAAGNAGSWIGDRIVEGQNIKEQRKRDIAAGVLTGANGGIPDKWLPNREWVDRGVEYAEYLKSLVPPPGNVPSSNFWFR